MAQIEDKSYLGTVAFISSGRLGWRTFAEFLEQSFQVSHHVSLTENIKILTEIGWFCGLFGILRKIIDLHMRSRRSNLKFAMASIKPATYSHIHCFAQLVAVPSVFSKSHLTYSVSIDSTWKQTFDEFLENPSILDRIYYERRIKAEKKVFKNCEFIHCTSLWAKTSLVNDYSIDTSRVHVATFPVKRFTTKKANMGGVPRMTFIGNDFERKGGNDLVKWHQGYLKEYYELHIVGSGVRSAQFGNTSSIHWHGKLDNYRVRSEIVPNSYIIVLPTYCDFTPIVCIEAASIGIPVITTLVGGIPELVIDGYNGFLIEPGDSEAFVNCALRLVNDNDCYDELSKNAYNHFEKRLSPEYTEKVLVDALSLVDIGSR